MHSLQSRLAIWISLALLAMQVLSGVLLYVTIRSALVAEFDASLQNISQTLATSIESDGTRIKSDMSDEDFPQFTRDVRPDVYQILDWPGETIEQSHDLLLPTGTLDRVQKNASGFGFIELSDGRPGRFVAKVVAPRIESDNEQVEPRHVSTSPPGMGNVVLIVARDTIDLNGTLARTRWWIAIVTGLTMLVCVAIAGSVAKAGLLPLKKTAKMIEQIDMNSLEMSLDPEDSPSEVRSLITSLNQMLGRLQTGYDRERSFSANVAHELRTPVAGMKSTIEVALLKERDSEQYKKALSTCLAITKQTESAVENLLMLARIDAGKCVVTNEQIQMDELFRETCAFYQDVAEKRGLAFAFNTDHGMNLRTDLDKLRLILRNLIDNAVSYADENTTVEVQCLRSREAITIRVANTVSNLDVSSLDKMFDRFWQNDQARTNTGKHGGIGLALCRSLAEALGGSLHAAIPSPQHIEFILLLNSFTAKTGQ